MKINNKLFLEKLVKQLHNKTMNHTLDRLFFDAVPNHEKTPTKAVPHVGLEIECFAPMQMNNLRKIIFMNDLHDYVEVGMDASIRPKRGHRPYELRVLIPESELDTVFTKLAKFFKVAKIQVNKSCGLHVHLDMRHRSYKKCYKRLRQCQDVLFALVSKDRWKNKFCEYVIDRNEEDRYLAINKTAYEDLRTLEVRLHQGTTNVDRIKHWTKFLIKVVNGTFNKPIESKADVLKVKVTPEIKNYLKKTMKNTWFKEKMKVVGAIYRRFEKIDELERQREEELEQRMNQIRNERIVEFNRTRNRINL